MNSSTKIWLASSAAAVVLAGSVILNTVYISKYINLKSNLEVDNSLRLTTEVYDRDKKQIYYKEFNDLAPTSFYEITKTDPSFKYTVSPEFGAFLSGFQDYKLIGNEYFSISSPTHKECAGKGGQFTPNTPNACQVGASSLIISRPESFVISVESY
ncbi:hypothetical protein [Spiroplasma alleghenense]|uniref:Uncharacterized protein n=1 Tax=Spiroplasma alleghenense TaxID=216931 RepID=A0A345Z2E1_9MOLU|nr:hypothetical protein [Spiroplasma alleghenense]AXK50770.1 hypothetical protein SALLE_v1c00940 [Spiroplasma alleghenense]